MRSKLPRDGGGILRNLRKTKEPSPTRADILRGEYGPIAPTTTCSSTISTSASIRRRRSISGKNTIRFKMLKDDTRIQLDLFEALNVDKILLGETPRSSTSATPAPSSSIFPRRSSRPHLLHRLLLLRNPSRPPAASAASPSARIRPAALDQHRLRRHRRQPVVAQQGPVARRSGEHGISVAIPNDLVDVSNGKFVGKTDLGDGYTRWDWLVHYPINNYDVSLNIGNVRALLRQARRPAARFLRAARRSGEGQEAVRAGQRNDRSLPALLRRVSLQEGRLQADRSALLRHGAPERRDLRQPLRQRLPGARLDRRRHQPALRLHHHPRERPRVVRQRVTAADVSDMWIHEGWTTYLECLYVEYMWGKTMA
jgi:hypothetical protein